MRLRPPVRSSSTVGAVSLLAAAALTGTAFVTPAVGAAATSAAAASSRAWPAEPAASRPAVAAVGWQPVPDGKPMSYVVNTRTGVAATFVAERAVRTAGGSVVQSWPSIGVVVARSSDAHFRTNLVGGRYHWAVQSVGATRTVPIAPTAPTAPAARASAAKAVSPGVTPDPREGEQWDMQAIKADRAHQITDGSRAVRVGVLDSGIDDAHPDLAPNFDAADSASCINGGVPDRTPANWKPTTSGHGTHVAGTIAAARNGIGIVGVAPNVRIASVKVVDDGGFIYPEYAICGFMWAGERHLDVTNNSYFVDPWNYWCRDGADQQAVTESVRRAVDWSRHEGVISAAAAGNSNYDLADKKLDTASPDDSTPVTRPVNNRCLDLPTELPGVVTVASTTRAGDRSGFSNYGAHVIDVAAPGSSILSTWPGGRYQLLSGTSMATPHVAGVLALLKSTHPHATPAQLLRLLRGEADDKACPAEPACVGPATDNGYFGDGVVDALDAVTR